MLRGYKTKLINFAERISAILVPIVFVFIERYFSDLSTYYILDAYILTQFLQVILGASIFLVFYKKNISIWNTKLYKAFAFSSVILGYALYKVTGNILLLFSVSYIVCIPLELQNVFLGRHYINLSNRFISVLCAILVFSIFRSLEMSYASERAVFLTLSLIRSRDQKKSNAIITWRDTITSFQIFPIYATGLFTVVYGKIEQLYLMQLGDKIQLANYILILRFFDVGILVLNSIVLAQISSAAYNLSSVRQLVDVVCIFCIATTCMTTLYFSIFTENMLIIICIIIINYYFMAWGVIKALYTHHTLSHGANLRCQMVGVALVILYFLVLGLFYSWDALPFIAIIALPAVGQIGANLLGPAVFKSERQFLYSLFHKESS